MRFFNKRPLVSPMGFHTLLFSLFSAALFLSAEPAFPQVSPAEILNPELKAAEAKYFPELKALNRGIAATKFPYPFALSRFVGLDPGQQAEADSRGVEFVRFHERVVLKITGNYNAAYNADLLTRNERASRTFRDVVAPVLQLVAKEIPPDVTCDAIGVEVSYHARTPNRNYDYEGKEILVIVLDRPDAFSLPQAASDAQRQEILNRSEIYLNGEDYGLALGERDPLTVEALARSLPRKSSDPSPAAAANPGRLTVVSPKLTAGHPVPGTSPTPGMSVAAGPTEPAEARPAAAASTQEDADRLQSKFQPQLDALVREGAAKFHFVDYAPPSFVVFRKQLVLQVTLRNPLRFDAEKSSIYKRAAQSFDLFLALQLKDLVEKVPADAEFDAFDFTVLNQLAPGPHASSEAVEFIFPRKPLRQFIGDEITNQQLIEQSVVLVNGVRIALNLQLVE